MHGMDEQASTNTSPTGTQLVDGPRADRPRFLAWRDRMMSNPIFRESWLRNANLVSDEVKKNKSSISFHMHGERPEGRPPATPPADHSLSPEAHDMTAQTYTLYEAQLEIARRECQAHGHSFSHIVVDPSPDPVKVLCDNCGKSWHIARNED